MTVIPHVRIAVAVTAFVLVGFAGVSAFALVFSNDQTTQGNIIGTWINFAVLAVGFWLGSSSGGKAKDGPVPADAAEAARQTADAANEEADAIEGART